MPLNPGVKHAHPPFAQNDVKSHDDPFHVYTQLLLLHGSVVVLPVVVDPVVVLPVVVDSVVVLPVVVDPVVVDPVVVLAVVVLPVVVDPVVVDPVVVLAVVVDVVLVVVLVVVGVSTSGSSSFPHALRPHQTVPLNVGIASVNR